MNMCMNSSSNSSGSQKAIASFKYSTKRPLLYQFGLVHSQEKISWCHWLDYGLFWSENKAYEVSVNQILGYTLVDYILMYVTVETTLLIVFLQTLIESTVCIYSYHHSETACKKLAYVSFQLTCHAMSRTIGDSWSGQWPLTGRTIALRNSPPSLGSEQWLYWSIIVQRWSQLALSTLNAKTTTEMMCESNFNLCCTFPSSLLVANRWRNLLYSCNTRPNATSPDPLNRAALHYVIKAIPVSFCMRTCIPKFSW